MKEQPLALLGRHYRTGELVKVAIANGIVEAVGYPRRDSKRRRWAARTAGSRPVGGRPGQWLQWPRREQSGRRPRHDRRAGARPLAHRRDPGSVRR